MWPLNLAALPYPCEPLSKYYPLSFLDLSPCLLIIFMYMCVG